MSGLNILDIGCGTGEFLSYCQIKGMTVRGVEPNERGQTFAIKNNLTVSEHLNFVDINPGSIDAITMWHVIEHIHDLRGTLLKIYEYLNSMGVLIIAVPNSNSFDAKFFKEYWAAYDVPRHIYHFSKQNITHLAESFGFKVIKVVPQKFDAYYVSMLSLRYKYNKILSWLFPLFGLWFNIRSYYDKNRYSSLIFVLKKKNN
jgi:predicted TPR repeat methyltransferase